MKEEVSIPLPDLDEMEYAKPFWVGAQKEKLMLQRCGKCNEYQFYPRPWCQFCSSEELEWVESEGVGEVYSYTIIEEVSSFPEFHDKIPYIVAYVDLIEGPRICTNIVESDNELDIGQHVEVIFVKISEEISLPKFKLL